LPSSSPAATPAHATLSLHDALPIFADVGRDSRQAASHSFGQHIRKSFAEGRARHHHIRRREQARNVVAAAQPPHVRPIGQIFGADRKSTRLNSSHVAISYAVFCLKK